MDEAVYESPRLVPRERPGWALLDQVAEQEGWELIADNVGEGYARYSRERSWRVREDLFVHMVHDNLSEHCGVTVTSTDRPFIDSQLGARDAK